MAKSTIKKNIQAKQPSKRYELIRLEAEIISIKKELYDVKRSIKYQLGYHLVNATTLRGFIRLPLAIYRVYKQHRLRVQVRNKKSLEDEKKLQAFILYQRNLAEQKERIEALRALKLKEDKARIDKLTEIFIARTSNTATKLKVAGVMDEFTFQSYHPECNLHQLEPEGISEQLNRFSPDFVFIESAWRGKDGLWKTKVSNLGSELYEVIEWCRLNSVPTMLWNKEDPVHFSTFLPIACVVDYVFTTDIDCIPKYKGAVGHDRVYLLPFAAQPEIHNPIEQYQRQDKFCFAGSYYLRYPERQRDFASIVDTVTKFKPLDIYDRNFENPHPHYTFPDKYKEYILGFLPFSQIDKAYKGYNFGINMNTIKQSQTMFARRVYELLASNTAVISNFSRGVRSAFGDLVICSDEVNEIYQRLKNICKDDITFRKFRLLGLRKVMQEHTYKHRFELITSILSNKQYTSNNKQVFVVAFPESYAEEEQVYMSYNKQLYQNKQLVMLPQYTTNKVRQLKNVLYFNSEDELTNFADKLLDNNAFVAIFHPNDFYGDSYLTDSLLAFNYTKATVIGKFSFFVNSDNGIELKNNGGQYKPCDKLPVRASMFKVTSNTLGWLKQNSTALKDMIVEDGKMYAIDEFNYCFNGATLCKDLLAEKVLDLDLTNQGVNYFDSLTLASKSLSASIPKYIDSKGIKSFNAESLRSLFSEPASSKVNLDCLDNNFILTSKFSDDEFAYFYTNKAFNRDELNLTLNSLFKVEGNSNLSDVRTVFEFQDATHNKISHAMNNGVSEQHGLAIPENCVFIRFGFRVQGKGCLSIKRVTFGEQLEQPSAIIGKSNILVLTKQYPAYDDLYKYGFLHSRVRAYKLAGMDVDIFRITKDQGLTYREFEGIDIAQGDGELLDRTLALGAYKHVLVHMLDSNMWSILEKYLDKIKVTVWAHGAEIQLWNRREFEFEMMTESEIVRQKVLSDQRKLFWQNILSDSHPNLHLVFVSKYLKEQAITDLELPRLESQMSVINNFVDPSIFDYQEKKAADRLKILSVRPYSKLTYANDLTVSAIIELSHRDFFTELEFTLVGDGELFEDTVLPVRNFKNVKIVKNFLTQKEISEYHKNHGVLLVPTRMDTQGVSRDEAMSSGLVPITTDVGAISEFVDSSCSIICPAEDYLAIADAVEELYMRPDLFLNMSKAASKHTANRLNATNTITKEIGVIETPIN